MTPARLSCPPLFTHSALEQGHATLAADNGAIARIFVLEEDIVRVLLMAGGTPSSPPSWAVAPGATDIAEPGRDRMDTAGFACPAFVLDQTDAEIRIETARLRLTIARRGFHCTWHQRTDDGWVLAAADRPTQAYNFGWWDHATYHYVARRPGERIYGLGERSGPMDRSGRRYRLLNLDPMGYDARSSDPLYKSIPYILAVSADGHAHGTFYDTSAEIAFDFGAERDNYHGEYRHVRAEGGDLDYYMIAGPDAAAVTRRFTWLTGRPALMPRWALGYSGSTMTYTDAPDAQAQMARFIDGIREHDIACQSFHLSSGYTSIGDRRYVFHWNREKFPDPAGFVASYAEAGVRLVANIKPALLRDHPRHAELAESGLFVNDAQGQPVECQFWDEVGSYLDFTNPEAAAWWRGQVTEQLLEHGIAATWNDNNEFEVWDLRAMVHGFGLPRPAADLRAVQTLLMMRASRHAQLAHAPQTRPYLVSRAGMAGMQRYVQTWSGDNFTSWETLRYNHKMGLGLALSGVSNIGHDVGGFAGPAPEPELFVRWVQAGILMPRFSIHSWNTDGTVNEPWMYPEHTARIAGIMALRRFLIPHFYDLLWRHHAHYEPVLRPLWLDYPSDPRAWDDGDSFLLGPDLLAAPVVEPGVDRQQVHLPAGNDWHDLRDDRRLAGGIAHTVPAPLDGLPPLFARAGSAIIVDLAPGGFGDGPAQPAVLVYPPAGSGSFTWHLFDDDGDSWPDGAAPPLWELTLAAGPDTLDLVLSWTGSARQPASTPCLLLPAAENRAIRLAGQPAQAPATIEVHGVRKLRIDLPARG